MGEGEFRVEVDRGGEAITKPMRMSRGVVVGTLATVVKCVVKLPVLVPVGFPSRSLLGRVLAAWYIRPFVGRTCCQVGLLRCRVWFPGVADRWRDALALDVGSLWSLVWVRGVDWPPREGSLDRGCD